MQQDEDSVRIRKQTGQISLRPGQRATQREPWAASEGWKTVRQSFPYARHPSMIVVQLLNTNLHSMHVRECHIVSADLLCECMPIDLCPPCAECERRGGCTVRYEHVTGPRSFGKGGRPPVGHRGSLLGIREAVVYEMQRADCEMFVDLTPRCEMWIILTKGRSGTLWMVKTFSVYD
jgi:hypothetical protein